MFIRRGSAILRSPDPDPTGGGGGGDPAPAFSEDQIKAIGQVVNQAITSHKSRKPEKSLADELKGVDWKTTLAPIFETWATENKLTGQPPGDQPTKPDPKLAALEAKLQALEIKGREDAEKIARAQAEARDKDAFAALRGALGPHVRQDALEIAASHLFTAQKRVTFDENGNPLFTARRASYAGGSEEDVPMPLADGVQHWLKSNEAKFFLPSPSGAAPAGGAPSQRRAGLGADGMPVYDKPATTDAEKARRAAEQAQALAAKYPHLAGT